MSAPLTIGTAGTVTPHPGGQTGFATDFIHRYIALEGGWNSGKSFIGSRKLLTLHTFNGFDLAGQPTFVRSAVVAPTHENIRDFCLPHLEDALDEAGMSYDIQLTKNQIVLHDLGTTRKPSLIMLRSGDKPERITGWVVGAAWGDEAARWKQDYSDPTKDAYLQLIGRVRDSKARFVQLMLTYTNEGDATRVYREFRSGKPEYALYCAPTAENPHAAEFVEALKGVLSEELAKQYLKGGAISLAGSRIYSCFDQATHVDDSLELQRSLPIHVSIDFNISPGMHIEIGQENPATGEFTDVYEVHERNLDLVPACRRVIMQLHASGCQDREVTIFGDASGGARSAQTGNTSWQIVSQVFSEAGITHSIRVPKANPMIIDRFNAMNCCLRSLDGQSHYRVHPRCKRLIADLAEYKRDDKGVPDTQGNRLSHASDAASYRIWYRRPVVKPGSKQQSPSTGQFNV